MLGHALQLFGKKSAKEMRSRSLEPFTTGAASISAPLGIAQGGAEFTAMAAASLSFMMVISPGALAWPPGIGVGPTITRTAAADGAVQSSSATVTDRST